MRKTFAALLCATVLFSQAPGPPIAGFRADAARREAELEARFDQSLNRQNYQQWLKRLSSKPHHVGSPASKAVAEYIAEQFRNWGYETKIETFYPLFPTPKTRLLEMVAPQRFTAKIEETAVE